ncbi:UMTA [Coccidioides immitis H538.4]|uniref:UMTA n=1 Tax=Coccidioides immitis H538.4 TaxID=396776 RepID=A0A0J8RIG3_COCIT|nr:UMTA [Coccidioides immitis H538.4]
MAHPIVQRSQKPPRIVYDWNRNLYVAALAFDSGVLYFPLCPGVASPGPVKTIHMELSREVTMVDVPAPDTCEPRFGSDYDEDDTLSTTTALASEFVDYPYDYGRRYNAYKEGEYWAPNDDVQQNQMDVAHHMFYDLLDGKLADAPISKDVREVIDLGAGNGAWAVDFADEYPSANVTGIDYSAIQPNNLPSNCNFIIDDVCDKWCYPPNYFDLVHIRQMYGSVTDWHGLYASIYRHLRPGGWVDQQEMSVEFKSDNDSLPCDHPLRRWSRGMLRAGEISGKTFQVADQACGHLLNAGFVNIIEKKHKVPVGTWSEDPRMRALGKLNLEQIKAGIDGWTIMPFMRELRWSYVDMRHLIRDVLEALEDPNVHLYIEV